MGTGFAKNKKPQNSNAWGSISLQLHKQSYHPGDVISGKIFLEILKPCQNTHLTLNLKGKEVAYNIQTTAGGGGTVQDTLNSGSRWIVKQKFAVCSWESLSIGHYEIPFSLTLPTNIPASFHIDTTYFAGYIRYFLETNLQIHHSSNLESKQNIIIREPIDTSSQSFSKEFMTKLKSWYFVPKGHNFLRAFIGKTLYSANEIAEVMIEFDNSQSRLDNLEISFSLIHKIRIGNAYNPIKPEMVYASSSLAGVPAKSPRKTYSLILQIPGFLGYDHDLDLRKDHWPQNKYSSDLPSITRGKLIKSELFLEVFCKMKGSHKNSKRILCPIQLNQPEPPPETIALPDNWNPKCLQKIYLECQISKSFLKFKQKSKNKKKGKTSAIESDMSPQDYELQRGLIRNQV